MKITIEAESKEVTELVLTLQKQNEIGEIHCIDSQPLMVSRDEIYRETRNILSEKEKTS